MKLLVPGPLSRLEMYLHSHRSVTAETTESVKCALRRAITPSERSVALFGIVFRRNLPPPHTDSNIATTE